MKKFYLFALAISISYCSFGQRMFVKNTTTVYPNTGLNGSQAKVLTPTDTLGWYTTGGTPTVYTVGGAGGSGYIGGVNNYGDVAKIQHFVVSTGYIVEGCIFWFGGKKAGGSVGDPSSKVTCNLYNMDAIGENSDSATAIAPGTVASSVDVLWDDIDTSAAGAGGFVFVTFPAPFVATADYGAGVDFSTLASTDTTGLVSNASGEAGATQLSWELWNDGSLHTVFSAWGTAPNNLDIDWAIFPIVDNSTTGINELSSINGIKLYQNQPNPFNSKSTVNYELDNNAKNVKIIIFDLNGKLVKIIEQGNQNAGKYNIELNSSDFSSGTYTFAIQADNHRVAKSMNVIK